MGKMLEVTDSLPLIGARIADHVRNRKPDEQAEMGRNTVRRRGAKLPTSRISTGADAQRQHTRVEPMLTISPSLPLAAAVVGDKIKTAVKSRTPQKKPTEGRA